MLRPIPNKQGFPVRVIREQYRPHEELSDDEVDALLKVEDEMLIDGMIADLKECLEMVDDDAFRAAVRDVVDVYEGD